MLRDTTSTREVPFRDVHDSITTTAEYEDLRGASRRKTGPGREANASS
jgi:hypothetical protein